MGVEKVRKEVRNELWEIGKNMRKEGDIMAQNLDNKNL